MSMHEFETLKRLVAESEDDISKAAGGNKAARTRARKKMQEIKAAAQDVRKTLLEGGSDEGGDGGDGGDGGTGGTGTGGATGGSDDVASAPESGQTA